VSGVDISFMSLGLSRASAQDLADGDGRLLAKSRTMPTVVRSPKMASRMA